MGERVMSCACGQVRVAVIGEPIVTAACYCDDCQAGAAQVQGVPGARAIMGADGGTWSALYRKDRHRVLAGADRLRRVKLRPKSSTNRVVASCCNSPMLVDFDRGPHWVAMYRPGYSGEVPGLEMRLQTRFAPAPESLPRDGVPNYRAFPPRFITKLLGAWLAMLFGR